MSKDFQNFAIKHQGVNSMTMYNYVNILNKKAPKNMTRGVVIESQENIAIIDVFSKLMESRTIFIGTPIMDEISNIILAQLLYLDSVDNKKDITLYINSPGGSIYAGYGIYDTANYISSPINTTCVGIAASMAYILMLIPNDVKRRSSLPHSRLMQHQPMTGVGEGSQASDIEIANNQIQTLKKELYTIVSEKTGQTYEKVYKDADRDHWMTAKEALDYGVIGKILSKENKK